MEKRFRTKSIVNAADSIAKALKLGKETPRARIEEAAMIAMSFGYEDAEHFNSNPEQ